MSKRRSHARKLRAMGTHSVRIGARVGQSGPRSMAQRESTVESSNLKVEHSAPRTPGSLYEFQRKGVTKFAFRK